MKETKKELAEKREYYFRLTISILLFALLIGVIAIGIELQYNPETDCSQQINESFINGTQIGYLQGIYDTSKLVLEQGILPVFDDEGNIQYLNLTQGGK